MQNVDYSGCILKAYPAATIRDFELVDIDGIISISYWNLDKLGAQPSLEDLELHQWLGVVKKVALNDIKEVRQLGLDRVARSSGILSVYQANYEASINVINGQGTILTKTGMTSHDYCLGFAKNLGMTVEQFAQYIVNENVRMGPTAYQIERRYLALTYGGDSELGITPINMIDSVDHVQTAASTYRKFCLGDEA
jgi:hypothetical protein